jgi:hypothetical protein
MNRAGLRLSPILLGGFRSYRGNESQCLTKPGACPRRGILDPPYENGSPLLAHSPDQWFRKRIRRHQPERGELPATLCPPGIGL